MNDFIWILTCFLLVGIAWIFLGIWTYKDATNRGLNAKLWSLIVAFAPSGIGLLIYFLVGRKQSFIKCVNCSNSIPSDSKYCNKCGNVVTEIKIIEKKPTKNLIIGFIISFALSIGCFIGFVINNEDIEFMSGYSIFLVEVNTKTKWNISYYKSSAKFSRTIDKKENQPSSINIDASCDEGELYLKLTQNSIQEVIDISNSNGPMKIDLSKFNNSEIKLELIDKNCKGVGVEAYWE